MLEVTGDSSVVQAVEFIFGVTFVVYGLSHMLQGEAWRRFFRSLKEGGNAGIIIGMYTFATGIVFALLHNRWTVDLGLVVTLVGWAMLFKAVLYLLLPSLAERALRHEVKRNAFKIVGVLMIAVGVAALVNAGGI
ncbi:MAG: hypothetical protein IH851_00585 [Armatimonadetes bacterium]|nr:hypothetical protein [Armatimonadota bacterium]